MAALQRQSGPWPSMGERTSLEPPSSLFSNSTKYSGQVNRKCAHLIPEKLFSVASSLDALRGHNPNSTPICTERRGDGWWTLCCSRSRPSLVLTWATSNTAWVRWVPGGLFLPENGGSPSLSR